MRILVTGGTGFLGRHVVRTLLEHGHSVLVPSRSPGPGGGLNVVANSIDLKSQMSTRLAFQISKPDVVVHLAAEVGGIGANRANPGRYCYANLAMGLNVVEESRIYDVKKFVMVGTVCSYPCDTPAPFKEGDLWNGFPEITNAPYGIAKRAIMELLRAYSLQYGLASTVLIPTNLYGPGDNFDPETSHVIPAMVRKMAGLPKEVRLWGTGRATREFLYVTDAARAVVMACEEDLPQGGPLHRTMNLGSGEEIRMSALARKVAWACGYDELPRMAWDCTMPDGQPRRLVDSSRAKADLGWEPQVRLDEGLAKTVEYFRSKA